MSKLTFFKSHMKTFISGWVKTGNSCESCHASQSETWALLRSIHVDVGCIRGHSLSYIRYYLYAYKLCRLSCGWLSLFEWNSAVSLQRNSPASCGPPPCSLWVPQLSLPSCGRRETGGREQGIWSRDFLCIHIPWLPKALHGYRAPDV